MNRRSGKTSGSGLEQRAAELMLAEGQSPYEAEVWRRLIPGERLRRSWQLRSRLPDPNAVHDRKLFPRP